MILLLIFKFQNLFHDILGIQHYLGGVERNVRSLPWFIVYWCPACPDLSWSTIRLSIDNSHYLLIINCYFLVLKIFNASTRWIPCSIIKACCSLICLLCISKYESQFLRQRLTSTGNLWHSPRSLQRSLLLLQESGSSWWISHDIRNFLASLVHPYQKVNEIDTKLPKVTKRYRTRKFHLDCSMTPPIRGSVHRNGTYPTLKTFLRVFN